MNASAHTFTVDDLVAHASQVFAAAKRLGSVDVSTREGETFVLSQKRDDIAPIKTAGSRKLPDFGARWKRIRDLGYVEPASQEQASIDRSITGE